PPERNAPKETSERMRILTASRRSASSSSTTSASGGAGRASPANASKTDQYDLGAPAPAPSSVLMVRIEAGGSLRTPSYMEKGGGTVANRRNNATESRSTLKSQRG